MKRFLQIVTCLTLFWFIVPSEITAEDLLMSDDEAVFVFFSLPDGEAMLIQSGDGRAFLVNTGSSISEKYLLEQMNQLGIKHLDGLILTNQDKFTCGNVNRLMKRYNVKRITYSHTLSPLCAQDTGVSTREKWSQGETHKLTQWLTVRVLPAQKQEDMSLLFQYGKTSILYLASGDLSVEEKLLNSYPIKAEIIKVGDYARTQSPSAALLEKVDPHVALIYPLKGVNPNVSLLERLDESWIDVYQLKKVGTTSIHCTLEDYDLHPK